MGWLPRLQEVLESHLVAVTELQEVSQQIDHLQEVQQYVTEVSDLGDTSAEDTSSEQPKEHPVYTLPQRYIVLVDATNRIYFVLLIGGKALSYLYHSPDHSAVYTNVSIGIYL